MICPNKECGYQGFAPNGLCPKCGERLLPNEMQHLLKQSEKDSYRIVKHYCFQVLFRIIESAIFCVIAYGILKFLILSYNGLAKEMEGWTLLDEKAPYMLVTYGIVFGLVILFTFRSRFHKPWF